MQKTCAKDLYERLVRKTCAKDLCKRLVQKICTKPLIKKMSCAFDNLRIQYHRSNQKSVAILRKQFRIQLSSPTTFILCGSIFVHIFSWLDEKLVYK